MDLNGQGMDFDMNSVPHDQPSSNTQDLDLQLQPAVDEVKSLNEQLSSLDLSVLLSFHFKGISHGFCSMFLASRRRLTAGPNQPIT